MHTRTHTRAHLIGRVRVPTLLLGAARAPPVPRAARPAALATTYNYIQTMPKITYLSPIHISEPTRPS